MQVLHISTRLMYSYLRISVSSMYILEVVFVLVLVQKLQLYKTQCVATVLVNLP